MTLTFTVIIKTSKSFDTFQRTKKAEATCLGSVIFHILFKFIKLDAQLNSFSLIINLEEDQSMQAKHDLRQIDGKAIFAVLKYLEDKLDPTTFEAVRQ